MVNKTAIALSGGIDSLVAAFLLKEQGHDLIGVHFVTGYESCEADTQFPGATQTDIRSIVEHQKSKLAPLGEQLDIPLYIIDLSTVFKKCVVDYFTSTYRSGKTPNPCLVCNPDIKFKILLQKAALWGATQMATGHYARVETDDRGRTRLLRGVDTVKDQSYFLARLTPKQLKTVVLPLGALTKQETRRMAREKGLKPIVSQESQDICFIKNTSYIRFLQDHAGLQDQPGPIKDINGCIVGRHKGLHRFTIGQRRGINCPAARPYYVVRLEPHTNCLVVGHEEALLTNRCLVTGINWFVAPPVTPKLIHVQIRYRHTAVPARLYPLAADEAEVVFDPPEPAVTPGQGAVFYLHQTVLGAGWIQ